MALGIGVILMISVFTRLFFEGNSESSPESVTNENSESVPTDDNPSLTDKGNTFFNQAQYDSALLYYEKALALDPGDQYAQYNRALVFFMKKEFRKSITLTKKCLREHPDYNEAWWLLGDGYSSVNNFDSAAVCLEKAYRNDFNDPNFLQLMGDVYRQQNNLPKAAEFYKKVILQDTTKVEVYQQLIDLDPDNADLYRQKVKGLSTN
jgi:tetratricopeptide (TPR) repeat protein